MKFYLVGQKNLATSGCEALMRTVIGNVCERLLDSGLLVPTFDLSSDSAQWLDMTAAGREFVPGLERSSRIKWASLWTPCQSLAERENNLRIHLAECISHLRVNAGKSTELLVEVLR